MTLFLRLVAYAPNGDRLGTLPHPLEVDVGWPLNDVPSLKLNYSRLARGAELLADPVEVAVELSDGTVWAEPPDGRFLRIARSGDLVDRTGRASFDLPGYGWQLRKLRLYPPRSAEELVDGKRPFLSATAGRIVSTWVAEGRERGALPGLEVDFDTATDSSGEAWSKILTIYYSPGMDLLTVLGNLADQGVIDWRMNGRTLQVFNGDASLARDLASGPAPVALRLGRDVTEAPVEGTLEDAASAVYVEGEEGFALELTNPDALAPWGRWEDYITQGGVSDEGTARLLAGARLEQGGRERVQLTRGIALDTAEHLPWRDYRPGDHVLAPGDQGAAESLRVRQITLSRDAEGHVKGNLTLNDRFLERELRQAKRTNGIVGGSTADGGSGARPAPEGPDARRPRAPEGLVVDTVAYLDGDGAARGAITATWSLVTSATDGTAMDVGRYELWWRTNEPGATWRRLTDVDHPDNVATASGFEVGAELGFAVRAVGAHNGLAGPLSAAYAVTIATDAEAPPIPSAPMLSTRLGVINVEWDGLGADGEQMPRDYLHTRVWMRGDQAWEHVFDYDGTPRAPWVVEQGELVVTPEGMPFAGSPPTLVRDMGSLDQVLELDVHRTDDSSFVWVAPRAGDAPANGSYYEPFLSVDLGSFAVGRSVTVRVEARGPVVRAWVDGELVFDGTLDWGQRFGTRFAIDGEGATLTAARIPADDLWEPVALVEGATTIAIGGQPYRAPRWFRLTTVDRSGNESAPGPEAVIATEPLVDVDVHPATIATGHLMANAVTADVADLGSLRAGIITANSITGDHIRGNAIDGKIITGATVRSASSGARWIADESGIRLFNSSGRRVFYASTGDGSVDGEGRFRAGDPNGMLVEITPAAFGTWPGIHFRGTSGSDAFTPSIHAREDGRLWLISSERVANSSGRAEVQLDRGGAWRIGGAFGNNLPYISADADGVTDYMGRLRSGAFGSHRVFQAGRHTASNGGTITYGAPNPSGQLQVQATALGSSASAVRINSVNNSAFSWAPVGGTVSACMWTMTRT